MCGAQPPLTRTTPREKSRVNDAEERVGNDVGIEERDRDDGEDDGATTGRVLDLAHGHGETGEHERQPAHERQEAVHEHHIDEQRHHEKAESLVFANRGEQAPQREHRPTQVEDHERDVRIRHADDVRQGGADDVVERVLRLALSLE